jgi:hypothetical protein
MEQVILKAYLKTIVYHQFLAVNQNNIEMTGIYSLFA